MKALDLTGVRFGRLVVVKLGATYGAKRHWECLCDCGNTKIVSAGDLRNGHTQSCGCLQKEIVSTHGLCPRGKKPPIYQRWSDLKARCLNPSHRDYKNYGGRGITVCKEWENDYYCFYSWAINNGFNDGLEIDRIDNDSGYSPDNCRFVSKSINSCNKRTAPTVGVYKESNCNGYASRVRFQSKILFSKNFKTFKEAAIARNNFIINNELPNKLTLV